ncbi:GATOR complex protein NPRL2-like isoform X2 [Acanthaster planci]|uniref:GATOR complex protein NPRL2-like isoform X2 n=1 Tax=Acanthaster planci TaxID=133434 RepID=A0A8B7Z6C1_ACAPL|nr:GATOR complex protein NPRL2-like isoform X2 [Acanthaster planci]
MATGKLECIFFSEFHPTAGHKITYQVPEEYVSRELFDTLHVYIITKPELQNRLITINALGHKIIGCPVSIQNVKYSRNALLFNLCFVCNASMDTAPYEPLVKKLANYLLTLELESGFLSNEKSKERLPSILADLLSQLNSNGKCSIPINESNTIHLKIVPPTKDPPAVLEHHVPMFLTDKNAFDSSQWDLTSQQILPYIDGVNHVQRIATEADVDINLVKICLQNMLYYGVITIVPIFQYSNVYITQPDINRLVEDEALREECIKYVTRNEMASPATLRSIIHLYGSLRSDISVKDLCLRFDPRSLNIDERHLIQFGVIRGLIKRLHQYPVRVLDGGEQHRTHQQPLDRYMNGHFNFDEICCKTGQSHQELEDYVENDANIYVLWK